MKPIEVRTITHPDGPLEPFPEKAAEVKLKLAALLEQEGLLEISIAEY